jgi:hypothetical protein
MLGSASAKLVSDRSGGKEWSKAAMRCWRASSCGLDGLQQAPPISGPLARG